jgi:hypothetical protein
MIINAPVKKTQEIITLLCQELSGDNKELIETIKPALTANVPELDEAGVDELIRIIKERRKCYYKAI